MRFTEDILACGVECIFALVKLALARKHFVVALETWSGCLGIGRNIFHYSGRDLRHRPAHIRLGKRFVNAAMAFCARTRSNVAIAGAAILLRYCGQSNRPAQEEYAEEYADQKHQPSARHVALTGSQRYNYL